ncbi:MAG TPA: C45 family peptidase [Gaiellales bacterium]|nr:C45 family peptidase [Gaiellales bacterium]
MTARGPIEIPVLRVGGTPRQVGEQLGAATAATVRAAVAGCPDAQIDRSQPFRDATTAALPEVIEELEGVAAGAGVDPYALFAVSVEQLWDAPPAHGSGRGRCTDLVAGSPATLDGRLWVAHNNDLEAAAGGRVVAAVRRVEGLPEVFTIGVGPWISVGFNAAGLSVTGNELSPTDVRPGIPPLLHMHRIVALPTLERAVAESLHPARSSSYNYVLAHRDGSVANIEGSATDAETTGLDRDGVLVHTNHYVCERMRRYEADPAYAVRSQTRYDVARAWLGRGPAGPELLRSALSDHANAPDSLCRHASDGSSTATVFWCIADVSSGKIVFGGGNPCTSTDQHHAFH